MNVSSLPFPSLSDLESLISQPSHPIPVALFCNILSKVTIFKKKKATGWYPGGEVFTSSFKPLQRCVD